MGIFARNRTQLSKIEVGYDLNYRSEYDAMDILAESYINDFYVFESILKRDMLDCIGVLTEASDDSNILTKLWEGILNIIKGFKEKINTIIDSVCDRIDKIKSDYYEKQIKKTESDFDKADLSEFTVKNLKLFNYDEFEKCKDVKAVLDKVVSLDIEKLKGQPIEAITLMKNKEFSVYDNIKSSLHDVMWSKVESKYPFKENSDLKTTIKTILKERARENTTIKRSKKEILSHLDKQETICKRMLKEAKKQKNVDKEKKEYDIAFARECSNITNEARRISVSLINSLLSEYKKIVSTSAGLYKAASKYAKKQLKDNKAKEDQPLEDSYIDIDYLAAIVESTKYEFDICMENL